MNIFLEFTLIGSSPFRRYHSPGPRSQVPSAQQRVLMQNTAGLIQGYYPPSAQQQQALANAAAAAAPGQTAPFVRPTAAFMPQFHQQLIVPSNQFPIYPSFVPQPTAAINLGNPSNIVLPSQSMTGPGAIVSSQASFQPPVATKQTAPVKRERKAVKIIDPSTGDQVKVDEPSSDSTNTNPPSSSNTTTGGGLLPEPNTGTSKPDVVQDFKTKVHSSMNPSSSVFVPGQPIALHLQGHRPNAIIRPPDSVKPTPQEKAPVIDKTPKEEEEVTPTTPLEPPPSQALEEKILVVEEPVKKTPSTVEPSPVVTQGMYNVCSLHSIFSEALSQCFCSVYPITKKSFFTI